MERVSDGSVSSLGYAERGMGMPLLRYHKVSYFTAVERASLCPVSLCPQIQSLPSQNWPTPFQNGDKIQRERVLIME